MPVLFQKHIDREDLVRNQKVLYVFGDNVKRTGFGGQAAVMRGEPNAVGIATKYSPQYTFGDSPQEVEQQKRIIDNDMKPLFEHVKKGGVVVWPAKGIGTGLAALHQHSPETFEYLRNKLEALLRTAAMFDRAAT